MRISAVIDCNVLVSGLLGPSTRPIVEAIMNNEFRLITSDDLFSELKLVLARSHITSRLSKSNRGTFLSLIKKRAVFVESPAVVKACRDPDDDALLGCALGHAQMIVTFDPDLLSMKIFKNVEIITPHEFIKRIQ